MAKFFDKLSPELTDFILRQKVFFVATAPPLPDGRINLSPKGMDTFRVLGEDTVAYLDLTGSGNETAAHIRHDPNHRVTVMFCSFNEKPRSSASTAAGRSWTRRIRPGQTSSAVSRRCPARGRSS